MANKSRIKFTHDDVRLKPIENLYDGFFNNARFSVSMLYDTPYISLKLVG